LLRTVSWRVETAPPVIAKIHKPGKAQAKPFHGFFPLPVEGEVMGRDANAAQESVGSTHQQGESSVVEYEPDPDLRDTEQVPLLEDGGIEAFIRREVLPYAPDAWVDDSATKIGYEISFTRHFYKPPELRTLDEIRREIEQVERETEGLLKSILE
jgi:type I restriction enzyme M protein